MATTGHETEAISVQGLKASLQKLKTDHIDGKAEKATTLAGYGITDAYTKSETYTKTEVNGLVDTPHQEYVTVDAYASLPATGSKDTIYRVSNYNGSTSQVDASVYSQYAWNGSQYIFLCVKSQIGEVFDISVYNNNAKYADLAAALNGGANIPQSLQKGGMSVKFVRTDDNKYVQYRSTSKSFSTNIMTWEQYNAITESEQSTSDLDVSDENGNVLARFKNGGIETKNFDSDKTPKIDNVLSSDLDVSDENGNVLARFRNGHFRTKNFDSNNIGKYAERPSSGYENFLVEINDAIENNDSMSMSLQDSIVIKQDRCIINFPVNYSATGKPVRLIVTSPGSTGQITSTTTYCGSIVPRLYDMLGEGYAVMQVNGTPGYTDGIEGYGGLATPGFLKSVQAAYEYVTKKYNIRKDGVLLSGYSQGTAEVWQIAANRVIPVKAMTLFGPCTDIWKVLYAYVSAEPRKWMCEQFGFVEKEANTYVLDIFSNIYNQGDIVTEPTTYSSRKTVPNDYEFAYILNNYEKWLGYDPICWGTSINIIGEQFRHRAWSGDTTSQEALQESSCFEDVANIVPCPMKMFVGTADDVTSPKIVNWYKRMADNAGMPCHVRYYEGGDHLYTRVGDGSTYTTYTAQTKYGGEVVTNVPSWEGMLFLERYDY